MATILLSTLAKCSASNCIMASKLSDDRRKSKASAILEAEHEKQKAEQRQFEKDKRQEESNQLRIKNEIYLKNRSAEDVTKEDLRDFM